MKKRKKLLDFRKMNLVELNDVKLLRINGGVNTNEGNPTGNPTGNTTVTTQTSASVVVDSSGVCNMTEDLTITEG